MAASSYTTAAGTLLATMSQKMQPAKSLSLGAAPVHGAGADQRRQYLPAANQQRPGQHTDGQLRRRPIQRVCRLLQVLHIHSNRKTIVRQFAEDRIYPSR